jgi:hypothetical protein
MAMDTSATCVKTVAWFIVVVTLIFVLMKYFEEEHLTLIQVNMVPNLTCCQQGAETAADHLQTVKYKSG